MNPRAPLARAVCATLCLALASLGAGCPADDDAPLTDAGADAGRSDAFLELTDPLSMPAVPTVSVGSFSSATTCAECHPRYVEQWAVSNHAYAMLDPLFRALTKVRQTAYAGAQDRFCQQCHSAIGTRGGEIRPGFSYADLSPVVLEGVTCEACHKVSGMAREFDSGHVLDESGPMRGTHPEPAPSSAHESVVSPLHATSEFCGGCHDVTEASGLELERPYAEWTQSPAAASGRQCQDCHMPESVGEIASGGPRTDTVHDHTFIGVDRALTADFILDPLAATEHDRRVEALLASAATVRLATAPSAPAGSLLDVVVTVRNEVEGHNLPTGSTFLRQVWLELIATDADGTVLYETGTLDADGDLRNYWSALDPYGDEDLVSLSSSFVDSRGQPTLFPWLASEHYSSSIPPLQERSFTYFVPTAAAAAGPIHLAVRLRFRTVAPFLLRALGLDASVDRVLTHDLATAATDVALP